MAFDALANDALTVANRYRLATATMDSPAYIAARIIAWHYEQEPLRVDLLKRASADDLVHDVGGIMRRDVFQSARYALAYHPLTEEPK